MTATFYPASFYLLPVALENGPAATVVTSLLRLHRQYVRVHACLDTTYATSTSPPDGAAVACVAPAAHCVRRLYAATSTTTASALGAWYDAHAPPILTTPLCTTVRYSRHDNLDAVRHLHNDTCSAVGVKPARAARVNFDRPSTFNRQRPLLIVVFNQHSHVSISLPYYEVLYKPLYPNLLYCLPRAPEPKLVRSV